MPPGVVAQPHARDARGGVGHAPPAAGLQPTCNLRRADLSGADLRDVDLRGADLREATLTDTDLRGAKYNAATRWPEGAEPGALGAVRVDA